MPVVPLTGPVRASNIRSAVNDIDAPVNINRSVNFSINDARLSFLDPSITQDQTDVQPQQQLSFSSFRKSQAMSAVVSITGETPSQYSNSNNGIINVSIVGSKISGAGNMTTLLSNGHGSKTGVSPSWSGLNAPQTLSITITDMGTGFSVIIPNIAMNLTTVASVVKYNITQNAVVTIIAETASQYNDADNGQILIAINSSNLGNNVSTIITGRNSITGLNPVWQNLHSGLYTITMTNIDTGFQLQSIVSVGVNGSTTTLTI